MPNCKCIFVHLGAITCGIFFPQASEKAAITWRRQNVGKGNNSRWQDVGIFQNYLNSEQGAWWCWQPQERLRLCQFPGWRCGRPPCHHPGCGQLPEQRFKMRVENHYKRKVNAGGQVRIIKNVEKVWSCPSHAPEFCIWWSFQWWQYWYKVKKHLNMPLSKVHDMNIIAIPRTIPGLVVVPVNRDLFSAANSHLEWVTTVKKNSQTKNKENIQWW